MFVVNQLTILGMLKGVSHIRSDFINIDSFNHILSALMPENRLALLVSLSTGLRIDDVLHLKSEKLLQERFTVKEMKTGKTKRVRLPKALRVELLKRSGRFYVFENRLDPKKPRTRQAVFKDLKRACELFRVKGVNLSPHSARKIYSVEQFGRLGSVKKVQELLNHSNEAVTMLYAMSDELTAQHTKGKKINIPK
jgi:integrase